MKIGDTDRFTRWDERFRWLRSRGLKGLMFVISDRHGGLRQAIAKHFQGASWQRCQVHRLGHRSVKVRTAVAAAAKLIFQAPDIAAAKRRMTAFSERFAKRAGKAVARREAGFDDAMAVRAWPEKYRRRTRTTNLQERLNEEIRRPERVIRRFPNDDSALCLRATWLAE